MDTGRQQQLRSRLERERAEDRGRLEKLEGPPDDPNAHMMEDGESGDAHRPRATRQVEEQDSLHQETRQRLVAIERALERMEDGTYGTCEECGRAIDEERLNALPMTARCIDHAPTENP